MNSIVLAVIIVSAIGLIAGIGLSIASKIMAVPVDEKAEMIREALPGANCGACGYSGCDGYAAALSSGKTDKTNLCSPGGSESAIAIAGILGFEVQEAEKRVAMVKCVGNCENTSEKMDYQGIHSCRAAKQLFGGTKSCNFGCMGLGDCVKVCPENAIHICNGIAVIDPDACMGCGLCVKTCPKNVIEVLPYDTSKYIIRCNSNDKGVYTTKACKAGCIGCGLCVRNCPQEAITLENNLAVINQEKCIGCGKCMEVCRRNCITPIV